MELGRDDAKAARLRRVGAGRRSPTWWPPPHGARPRSGGPEALAAARGRRRRPPLRARRRPPPARPSPPCPQPDAPSTGARHEPHDPSAPARAASPGHCVAAVVAALVGAAAGRRPGRAADRIGGGRPLTNLAHLDFLQDDVTPPAQAGHTTYRLAEEPSIGVLWTYADRNADGTYRRVGGGPYDPATDTWSQGAFNADDVSRAAVVYLRHWQQTGAGHEPRAGVRPAARPHLPADRRPVPNAGNVVLWMQPDGTLNPSPSRSSCPTRPTATSPTGWPAPSGRSVRAMPTSGRRPGLRGVPQGAAGPRDRGPAAADAVALRRATWQIDGAPDAGVAGRRRCRRERRGGPRTGRLRARPVDRTPRAPRCASSPRASPRSRDGDARHWPFGAVQPWALSRGNWHAWASQMPAALARAGDALGDGAFTDVAARDSGTFDPWLLTVGRAGQRPAADPRRPHPDRLRRRLPAAVAARDGRRHRQHRARTAGRRSSVPGTSAPTPGASRPTTRRPGAPSTASTAAARPTSTAGRSRRSTGCSRCSRSTRTRRSPRRPAGRRDPRSGSAPAPCRSRTPPSPATRSRSTPDVAVDRGVAVRRHRLRGAR